jgi:predicted DNA-binding transcriptional regulator AlpA
VYDEILRPDEAAQYLKISPSTLAKMRMRGGSDCPIFLKLGRRSVGYRRSDLEAFLKSRLRTSTCDQGSAEGLRA